MRLFIGPPMVGGKTMETLKPFLRRYGQPESSRSFMADWYKLCHFGVREYSSEWEGALPPVDIGYHFSDYGRLPDQPTVEELLCLVRTLPSEYSSTLRLMEQQRTSDTGYREIVPADPEECMALVWREKRERWLREFRARGYEVD